MEKRIEEIEEIIKKRDEENARYVLEKSKFLEELVGAFKSNEKTFTWTIEEPFKNNAFKTVGSTQDYQRCVINPRHELYGIALVMMKVRAKYKCSLYDSSGFKSEGFSFFGAFSQPEVTKFNKLVIEVNLEQTRHEFHMFFVYNKEKSCFDMKQMDHDLDSPGPNEKSEEMD